MLNMVKVGFIIGAMVRPLIRIIIYKLRRGGCSSDTQVAKLAEV